MRDVIEEILAALIVTIAAFVALLWRPVIIGLAAIGLYLLVTAPARAHSFYPYECCSDQDCWPMGKGEREPDPVLTPQGWRLHDGEIVAFAETRPSPDGRFHVCRRGGAAEGAVIRPGRPCLWAPPQGS